jgi:hypothetical protein
MNRTRLPKLLVPTTAILLAGVLLLHPQFDGGVYEGLSDQVNRWVAVHIALAVGVGLMSIAAFTLIDGLPGRAATVSRVALTVFPVVFIAWEATLGVGTGLMVDQANGLAVGDRGPVADSIQGYFDSPVLFGLSAIGNGAWIVAMIAAALAFRRAGARGSVVALLGLSSLFVLHDAGPVGAIGLTCFAAAAVLVQRDPRLGAQTRSYDGFTASEPLAQGQAG